MPMANIYHGNVLASSAYTVGTSRYIIIHIYRTSKLLLSSFSFINNHTRGYFHTNLTSPGAVNNPGGSLHVDSLVLGL
jgi:hypothetical protein